MLKIVQLFTMTSSFKKVIEYALLLGVNLYFFIFIKRSLIKTRLLPFINLAFNCSTESRS